MSFACIKMGLYETLNVLAGKRLPVRRQTAAVAEALASGVAAASTPAWGRT